MMTRFFLLLYVNDMLIAVNHLNYVNELKIMLGKEFDMKDLSDTKKILGMKIHMDVTTRKSWLSRKSYVKRVLDKFGISNLKVVSTPLTNQFKLSLDQCSKIDVKVKNMSKVSYVHVVGCLMYVMVYTRPYLAQVVNQVCKFMSKLGNHH